MLRIGQAAERTEAEENAVRVKQGRRAGTGMVHGQQAKRTAELLQELNGLPRFGKHSLICLQSNRVTSETQEVFSGGIE